MIKVHDLKFHKLKIILLVSEEMCVYFVSDEGDERFLKTEDEL